MLPPPPPSRTKPRLLMLLLCVAFGSRHGVVRAFGSPQPPPAAPAGWATAVSPFICSTAIGPRRRLLSSVGAAAPSSGEGAEPWAYRLVLLRHGESTWNRDNRYIGWTDVPLTTKGEAEANQAGVVLKRAGVEPDHVYTSYLKRAIKTAWLTMAAMGQEHLPETRAWQLNERMYGLAGLTPQEAYAKHGEAQVRAWAKSLTDAPPEVLAGGKCDPRREGEKYGTLDPPPPRTESLLDVQKRMADYWASTIQPHMRQSSDRQTTFLLVSHANAIRALMAHIDGVQTAEEIWSFEVPRAVPIIYHFDASFRPLRRGGEAGGGNGMSLLARMTATVLLPPAEKEEDGNDWGARLPSNS